MIRTQVYITEQEHRALQDMAIEMGKSQSELIRVAIDNLVAAKAVNHRDRLKQAIGIWADKKNMPDFDAIRKEFDRD